MAALIGQKRAEVELARDIAHDRVSHAYLFLGPASSGKATAARLFAQSINCQRTAALGGLDLGVEAEPDLDHLRPCGRCENCRRIEAGTHSEVMDVRPDSKSGQNISIDQAREIRRNAVLRPKIGKRRVYILSHAEYLNENSANCLLKTLEEPSDFVTLILCAPNPSMVLPTIRSRCRIIRFGLAPFEELRSELESRGTAPDLAASLARACVGRPGLAFSWSEDAAILEQRAQVTDLFTKAVALRSRAARDPATGALSLRLAEKLRALVGKDEPEDGPARPAKVLHSENLEVALGYLRDLLLLAGGAGPELAQNQDRISTLEEAAQAANLEEILDQIRTVREAQQLLERNVPPQLVFERMFWALISGPVPLQNRLFEDAAA